ncbi:MAG TPA: hypothetical protein VEN81_16480 [Planctomycetota bacterium]|nr:hypothetical protein [Planctomycetota bacterium]
MMRRLSVLVAAGLAACTQSPSPTPATSMGTRTTDLSTQNQAVQNLGLSTTPSAATSTAPTTSSAPTVIDQGKRFIYADVYVDLNDPTSQRQLAGYLLKPEVWMLDKFENTSGTARHFRFRKLAGPDGTALPEIDPLIQKP